MKLCKGTFYKPLFDNTIIVNYKIFCSSQDILNERIKCLCIFLQTTKSVHKIDVPSNKISNLFSRAKEVFMNVAGNLAWN